jgi:uncharacterized protein YxjI
MSTSDEFGPPAATGGRLLDHDRLVFRQKTKVIELTNEYAIKDVDGADVGYVKEEGQTTLKKAARLLTSLDQFLTHRLGVSDADGSRVLALVRPAKLLKSRVRVLGPGDEPVGEIVQRNVFGKIRFGLTDAAGAEVGEIRAENWRAWNFAIVDPQGAEVARITKTWEGLARTLFTTADHYLLELRPEAQGTLRLLALASAVGVDTALKQDERGLN